MSNPIKGSWEADFDASEYGAPKVGKIYPNFKYESACIEEFQNVMSTVKKVISDVDNITSSYGKLKTLFEEFTDFNSLMDSNANSLTNYASTVESKFNTLINSAIAALEDQVTRDESFQADLDQLTSLLNNGSVGETLASDASFSH